MIENYTMLVASDVSDRDGLGLELYDSANELVAEIFRDDEGGTVEFRFLGSSPVPFTVVEEFVASARRSLLD